MAEQSRMLTVERGRTRDATAAGLSHCMAAWTKKHVMWSREVCCSLELTQALTPSSLPSSKITLTLSNSKISKIKSGLFSGLSLLERPAWSTLPLRALLMPVVSVATRGYEDIHDS